MSPFKSAKQLKFLAAKKPAIFKKWKAKYGVPGKVVTQLKNKKSKRQKGGVLRK